MYYLEQRMKAVLLYIQYDCSAATIIRELGYPDSKSIKLWYEEYLRNGGTLHETRHKAFKYSEEQIKIAVDYYFDHGKNILRTTKKLGYPSHTELAIWIDNSGRDEKRHCKIGKSLVEYTAEQKKQAVIELCEGDKKPIEIAQSYGVTTSSLYYWKRQLLNEGLVKRMSKQNKQPPNRLPTDVEELQQEVDRLTKQADKYAELRENVKNVFSESGGSYGYRRVHASIKGSGVIVSDKVIRNLMKEEHLEIPKPKKRKYNSYKGEISPEVPNVIERNFHADSPNEKWLTDITEFGIPAGKVYLSPIIDCFDGLPVSWTIGTSPDAKLVNVMIDKAISTLHDGEKPIVHSDRGCHYRWPGWIERMETAGLTRSMSKKGCSPDNSACEGFFGRLKTEMFYGRSWTGVTIDQFFQILDAYIKWYAEKRIKLSLGGLSPLDYRMSLGFAA